MKSTSWGSSLAGALNEVMYRTLTVVIIPGDVKYRMYHIFIYRSLFQLPNRECFIKRFVDQNAKYSRSY